MRFCQYCGARLEDGQECTCPQAQQERQAKESQQGQDFQGYSFQQSYCYQHGYSTQQPPSQPESPEEQGSQEQGQQAQQGQPFAQVGKQVRDTTAQAAKSLKPFFAQYWKNPVEAVRGRRREQKHHAGGNPVCDPPADGDPSGCCVCPQRSKTL